MVFYIILNLLILKYVCFLLRGGVVWVFRYCFCGSKGLMVFIGYSLCDIVCFEGDN